MDRRKLHKASGQQVGKNKQIAKTTRAMHRAENRDAQRSFTPEVVPEPVTEVGVKPSRLDRLKKWRAERDAKKKEEAEVKKKPFVTVVKRGVFLDQTNYTELNKLSRKNATKTVKPAVASNMRPGLRANNKQTISLARNETSTRQIDTGSGIQETHNVNSGSFDNAVGGMDADTNNELENNVVARMDSATNNGLEDNAVGVDLLTVEDQSDLNATFELPGSVESDSSNGNQLVETLPTSNETSQAGDNVNQSFKSPLNKSTLNTSLNYVSPFVTMSRGKGSAHKEVKVRESLYKLHTSQSLEISPEARQNREAAGYFRFQVTNETENLMKKVDYWDDYKMANYHVDSVYIDQIDVAIGQTKLLITKKFKQFMELISQCEEGSAQPPVLPKDLEGFWSMVFMQVENCNERFRKLQTLKENDWVEVDLLPVKVVKQTKARKVAKKDISASSGIQKMIEEARIKMKEHKITVTATSSSNIDGAGNFSMILRQTPARLSMINAAAKTPKSIIKAKTPGGQRSTKSVAFASIESPSARRSIKMAVTPKPKAIKRRASTSGIPSETQNGMEQGSSSFLTPNFLRVPDDKPTSSSRRSHRRLFSVADK